MPEPKWPKTAEMWDDTEGIKRVKVVEFSLAEELYEALDLCRVANKMGNEFLGLREVIKVADACLRYEREVGETACTCDKTGRGGRDIPNYHHTVDCPAQ